MAAKKKAFESLSNPMEEVNLKALVKRALKDKPKWPKPKPSLANLVPGVRFYPKGLPELKGVVIAQAPGSTSVRWDDKTSVTHIASNIPIRVIGKRLPPAKRKPRLTSHQRRKSKTITVRARSKPTRN